MKPVSVKKWMAAMLTLMVVGLPALSEPTAAETQAASEATPATQQATAAEPAQAEPTQAEPTQPVEQTASPAPQTSSTPESASQPSSGPEIEPSPSEPAQEAPATQQPTPTAQVVETPRIWVEKTKDSFSAGQTMKCVLHREGGAQKIEVSYTFNGQTRVQTMEAGKNSVKIELGEAPESAKALNYELKLLESNDYEIKSGSLEIRVAPMAVFGFKTSYAGSVGTASGDSCAIVIQRADNGAQQAAKVAVSMPQSAYEAGYRLTGDRKNYQLDTTYYIEFRKGEMEKTIYLSNWSASIEQSTTISLTLQPQKGAMIKAGGAQVNVSLTAKDSNTHRVTGRFVDKSMYVTPGETPVAQVALEWANASEPACLRYEITDGQNYRLVGEVTLQPGQERAEIPLSTDDFEVGNSYVVNILAQEAKDVGNPEGSSLILYAIEDSDNPTASLDSSEYLIMPGQSLKVKISIDKVQPKNVDFVLSLGEQTWNASLSAGQEEVDLELDSIQEGGTLVLSAPEGIGLKTAQAEVVVSAALSDNLNFLSYRMVYSGGDGNAKVLITIGEPLDESAQFVLGISDDNTGNMVNITIPAGRQIYVAEIPENIMDDYEPGAECQLTLDMPDEAWQGEIAQAHLSVLETPPDLAGFEVDQLSGKVGDTVEVPLDLPQNFEGMVILSGPDIEEVMYPRYPLGSVEVELSQEGTYSLVLSDEKNGWVDENKDEVVITASAQ